MAQVITGTLAVWKDKKGFGFIKPDDGSDDIFIHITALSEMSRRPYIGDKIYFEMLHEDDGRSKAINAKIEGVDSIDDSEGSCFLKWLLIVLVFITVVIVCAYGYDKSFNDSQITEQIFDLIAPM